MSKFSASLLSVFSAEQCGLRTIKPNDSCQKCWQFLGLWLPDSTSFVGWHLELVINLPGSLPPYFSNPLHHRPFSPHSSLSLPQALELTSLLIRGKRNILGYLICLRISWWRVLQPQGDPGSYFFQTRDFSTCSHSWLVILLLNPPQTCILLTLPPEAPWPPSSAQPST